MSLQIRNPRAHDLAQRLARRRGVSITDAVIAALAAAAEPQPLSRRVADIAADLRAMARPGGQDLTKAEIDAMWGPRI